MPSEKRRRKRLEKQAKKRQKKRAEARASKQPENIREWMRAAARWPVLEARASPLKEHALATVMVARKGPEGVIAAGLFLVDLGCLGVKCAFGRRLRTSAEYRALVAKFAEEQPLDRCEPSYAAKIVLTGMAYARELGFSPDRDFRWARHVLDGIDPAECPVKIPCGIDAKPHYIEGPNDDAPRIINQLRARLGPDGFHFTCLGTPETLTELGVDEETIRRDFEHTLEE